MVRHDPAILDELTPDDNILVLDRIQDPGNMGTMIRTAVAAGYRLILASRGTVDIYSPKVLRATAGMVFDIPVLYAEDEDDLMRLIARSGRRSVVTVPSGGRPYYDEDLRRGIALIIGNEGNGASERLISSADIRVTLPMRGSIESLNAAVAAAILMYESIRI
jgi:TrmH family RNA methyltransferase